MTKFNLIFEQKYVPDGEISFQQIGTGCHDIYEDDTEQELNDQQIYKTDEHDVGTCYPKEIWARDMKKSMKYITG
jgi:hypothetical protein